ncbi:MAG TPA: HEAT repeat domain-containing protein [Bryobacteraceae bacterium]|nr:HEAT repeat domain-containing protein [Bryobacteraceae bacterium]
MSCNRVLFPAGWLAIVLLAASGSASAQETLRPKDVRNLAKQGSTALPRLQELLRNPDLDIRIEAVKAITDVGTQGSLAPLIQATADNDPEVQIRATDGLVNFYLPGYVQTGFGASIKRVGTSIKGKFTDTNDQVIDAFVQVRPDVIQALGLLVRGGASMEARANAARALGILRAKPAVPDLLQALRSKDTEVIYESLIALEKVRDESAAPGVAFLLHDLDQKVQLAAIETVGLLRNKSSVPELQSVLEHSRNTKVKRAALTSLAMLADERSRAVFTQYLHDKDDGMRAAAGEGFGRLKNRNDLPMLDKAFQDETKTPPRLALAFAQVMLGKTEISEFSPFQLLINTLNSVGYRGVAYAYLVELARNPSLRPPLYHAAEIGTKDEKVYLARVLAVSGGSDSVPCLEKLSHDGDGEVAQEGLRALRSVKARL